MMQYRADINEDCTVNKLRYRDAMSRLGAAVNIITTAGPEGDAGFTATAVCSVTDEPPTLLVCINRKSKSNSLIKQSKILCVNVLAHEHEQLSQIFAGVDEIPMAKRFAQATWLRLVTGALALKDAVASFDCTTDQLTEVGTHSVFFCSVRAIRFGICTSGLIYYGRAYHKANP